MKDVLEAAAKLLDHQFGLHIDDEALTLATLVLPLGSLLFWLYLSIRRWRGDFRAVSSDLEATAKIISHDTTRKFDSVLKQFNEISESMQGAINTRLDSLETHLRSTNVVDRGADAEIDQDAQTEKQKPTTRLKIAEGVRAKVIEKWLEGRTFRRWGEDPNCFVFLACANSSTNYEIWLGTPYRNAHGSDGSLAYTLEIWADGYKKLNFEWDMDGNYALRGYKKGDWAVDLLEWDFGPAELAHAAA